MESTRDTLLSRIAEFLEASGKTERQFGMETANDHKLIARLREGKATLATIEKIEARLASQPAEAA